MPREHAPATAGCIKPQFVDHRGFTLPRLVYSGDMLSPREIYKVAQTGWSVSFIYHVFNTDGELLYVGFTGSPLNRWDAHRRKATWWGAAAILNLYRVEGSDRNTAENGARHWEARAIHDALPRFNRSGPAGLPSKAVAQ